MPWIDTNGVCLRYDVGGSGSIPLVLVHEMGGAIESWDEVAAALAARYRIIRYDQRGHGASEKIRGGYTIADAVEDLASLLDKLGLDGPVLMAGCAVGAGVALQFTASHPARVRGLVAMAPSVSVKEEARGPMLAWASRIEAEGMRHFIDNEMLPRAYPAVLRTDEARFQRFRGIQIANDPSSYAATQRMLAACAIQTELPKIRCPVLLIAGKHDVARPPSFVETLVGEFPDARMAVLESGHFMPAQTPAFVAETIAGFFSTLAPQ